MKTSVEKRGLSPVIASTLMILLVLVLAAIIFFWARGFISEQVEKFGRPVEELCSSVDFSIVAIDDGEYYILEIVNRGNVGISAFEVKMYSGGNSEIVKLDISAPIGKSVSSEVSFGVMQNGDISDKVEIFPVLTGNVKGKSSRILFTCHEYPVLLLDF
ncbi:MAG: archaellin/type IV pilin N-terminal domain-containing protein [archaeon]